MARKKEQVYGNSCITPIYQNSSYYFENTEQVIKYHQNEINLGRYGRYDNPNWLEFESRIATLDRHESALLFASGMNAIVTTILTFARQDDLLLYSGKCYRNIKKFFNLVLPDWGIKAIPIDPTNDNLLGLKDWNSPKIIFIEMPSNPHLYLADIAKIRSETDSNNTILIVDSTLASPCNFQPQKFGADLTIHSCSKYISGHGDVIAGSVSGSSQLIEQIRTYRNIMGGVVDPHAAFLLNRSLNTLQIRMRHFNETGMEVATYLEKHPRIKRVLYTGLESHPHSFLAQKYLTGHGGVIYFELDASRELTSKFVDALQVPFMGTNFGSNQAMVEQCGIFTYFNFTTAEQQEIGINDSSIRLSVGYEDSNVLIEDIERAINKVM